MNTSLRCRLTFSAAAVVALAVVGFGAGVSFHLYRERVSGMEKDIKADANDALNRLHAMGEKVDWSDPMLAGRIFPSPREVYSLEIALGGRVLYRSDNMGNEAFSPEPAKPGYVNARLRGRDFRIGYFKKDDVSLTIGAPLDEANEIREDLLISYLLALPAVLIVAGGGSWWLARQALLPVGSITGAAEMITAERLSERLPARAVKDEIGHLVDVLNHMFDRLEKSFLQATRFTADASHELRTPLTILKGEIETALRRSDCPSEQKLVLANLQEETDRLQSITDSLLLLSRADAGKLNLERTSIDLTALLSELLEDFEVLAIEKKITLERNIETPVTVRADRQLLTRAIVNLLENGLKYNEEDGFLSVQLRRTDGMATLTVTNSGPGIFAMDAENLFQRFYRASSSEQKNGHGLGLSICREIAQAHGGSVRLVEADPEKTVFELSVPGVPG